MNPGIFLISDNEELVEMNEQPYDSEKLLQTWLAKYPELLVGNQIDNKDPRRFLLIEQECGVPSEEGGSTRWSIDHLFLDQDAIPTIVEVKRSSDTRIRREVVGQMLDYAANAVSYWPVSHMRERFAANCQASGLDPEEKIKEFLESDIEGVEEFWQQAFRNLQDRRVRLLFIADLIPTELQRIVEFLNDQMDQTEVLAIEIKQFVSPKGLKSLAPRVIGQTVKALEKKETTSRGARQDQASFFKEISQKATNRESEVAKELLAWAQPPRFTTISWGLTSFSPVLSYGAPYTHHPISVYTDGKLEIQFKRMKKRTPPFDDDQKRLQLLKQLNQIPEIDLQDDAINRFPRFPMTVLDNPQALERFKRAIEWTIEEAIAARQS